MFQLDIQDNIGKKGLRTRSFKSVSVFGASL